MRSDGFGYGVRAWMARIVLACSSAAMGIACASVTAANARFECVALHGGSLSNGNLGAFDNVCVHGASSGRSLLLGLLGFCAIVLTESLVVWLPRRFPGVRRVTRLTGIGWTPFLLYALGVWFTHGLASGVWFGAVNSWTPVAWGVAGVDAVAAWGIEGMRTLQIDRGRGIVTQVSRIGVDAEKRNVMLYVAAVVILMAIQFGDLGLVITGTGIPVLAMWIVAPVGALIVSMLLRHADSPSGYGKAMIAQQVMTLLCTVAMCVACWSDASRIVGLMTA